MTQASSTARSPGSPANPLSTVNTLGFSLIAEQPDDLEPEDVELVLDCPFCRRPVPYPGPAGDGSEALAECDRCDVYFEFDPSEVYPIAARRHARDLANDHGLKDIAAVRSPPTC